MHPKMRRHPIEKYFNNITWYHYYFFFFIYLSKLPIFWHVLNLIFLSPLMDYDCVTAKNSSVMRNVCPCEEPMWNRSVFTETVQTKYEILCEDSWLISFSESMLYVGTLIGSLLFGFLADKYGRLLMFCTCCFTIATAGCLVAVMPTIGSFIFMRCIEGIGVGGSIVTGYVLCVEYCGVRNREIVAALFHIPINLSHMTLAGVSYRLRNCNQFQIALSVPVFFFVLLKWLVLESPKWLIDNDRIPEASGVMKKILIFNKQPSEDIILEIQEYHSSRQKSERRKIKFLQIFRHRKLSLNLVCMSFNYFVCGMGYYGVSQYIGKMSGNVHANVAISGALLLPGTVAATFLLKFLNRRTFLMATNFLSGLFMLVTVFISSSLSWPRVVTACISNTFFFMSFIIVFLYGVELFPTSVRNSVLGFLSFLSRIGQIAAPPINALSETLSGIIFGVMAIFGAVMCYPLPETKDSELPSCLEDSKTLSRKRTITDDQGVRLS